MDENKKRIINMFISNIKGKTYDPNGYNILHDGAEGHWLEHLMGISANASNAADLFGYEMKKPTRSKTTFGDWSPDISLWGKKRPYNDIPQLDRDRQFLVYFGKSNPLKNGRYSWSGEPVPTTRRYNSFGQILKVDEGNNILAFYSFSEDKRADKGLIVPPHLQRENMVIAQWSASVMKDKVERKFNDKGWFKCFKNPLGVYEAIGFGDPIEYDDWIELVKSGTVFFDSGMYQGNKRPYSQWRANNNYWDELIDERYTEAQS